MLLPNTEANIVNNTDDLRRRINELKEVKALDREISTVDRFLLESKQNFTVSFEEKISLVRRYQASGDDVCLLRAVEIALHHVSGKNLLALNTGERSYSRAAMGSGCFAPLAGFFRNRGIEKQRDRLAEIDRLVNQLEKGYRAARVLHRLGLG